MGEMKKQNGKRTRQARRELNAKQKQKQKANAKQQQKQKVISNPGVAVDKDVIATVLAFLQSLSKHEFTHPVNALLTSVNGEVVVLDTFVAKESLLLILLGGRNERERESSTIAAINDIVSIAHDGAFKCRCQLGTCCLRRASNGIIINIDALKSARKAVCFTLVLVHGKVGAIECEMGLGPLVVSQNTGGLALAHVSRVGHIWVCGAR